jgi:hypothetical protein
MFKKVVLEFIVILLISLLISSIFNFINFDNESIGFYSITGLLVFFSLFINY